MGVLEVRCVCALECVRCWQCLHFVCTYAGQGPRHPGRVRMAIRVRPRCFVSWHSSAVKVPLGALEVPSYAYVVLVFMRM